MAGILVIFSVRHTHAIWERFFHESFSNDKQFIWASVTWRSWVLQTSACVCRMNVSCCVFLNRVFFFSFSVLKSCFFNALGFCVKIWAAWELEVSWWKSLKSLAKGLLFDLPLLSGTWIWSCNTKGCVRRRHASDQVIPGLSGGDCGTTTLPHSDP